MLVPAAAPGLAGLKQHLREMMPIHCLTALLCLATASTASAQSFIGGAVIVSWQPDNSPYVGTSNPSVPAQGIHGTALGGFGTVGVYTSPGLGFAAEFSLPSSFTADQVADKYRTHNTHRDAIVSGVFHVRPGQRRITGVIGLSYVLEQTNQQLAPRVFSSTGVIYEPFAGPAVSIGRETFGVVGGLDLSLPLGSRVKLTPQFRLHWINREDDSHVGSPRFLGLSSIALQPACGLQLIW